MVQLLYPSDKVQQTNKKPKPNQNNKAPGLGGERKMCATLEAATPVSWLRLPHDNKATAN